MTYLARGFVLLALCSFAIPGCGGHNLKDSAGDRLSLSNYDRVTLMPVEVDSGITHDGISDDLATHIRDRLSDSKYWSANVAESEPADTATSPSSSREIDLAVKVVKVRYPSRSKIIWLGSDHKMTCSLEVYDHATSALLGSVIVSTSVEPIMGNGGMLGGATVGIISRACIDTRKHDTKSLLAHMAKEIVKVLDRAKKRHQHSDDHVTTTAIAKY